MVQKSFATVAIGKLLNFFGIFFPGICSAILANAISHPRKGRLKDFQIKELERLTEFHELDHGHLPYYLWKKQSTDGPVILLCHGWESNAHRWKKMVQYLKNFNGSFIALDAPAHGRSESRQFTILTYAEAIRKMIVYCKPKFIIAHSVGSLSALKALTMLEGYEDVKIVCLSGPDSAMFVMRRVFDLIDLSPRMQRAFIQYLETKFNISMDEVDIAGFGHRIKNKGVLIFDKTDEINPIYCGELYHQHWQGSELKIIEGYQHSMRHNDVYGIVENYLRSQA